MTPVVVKAFEDEKMFWLNLSQLVDWMLIQRQALLPELENVSKNKLDMVIIRHMPDLKVGTRDNWFESFYSMALLKRED